jgi:hypothetical protein
MQGKQVPIVSPDVTTAAVQRMCGGGDTIDYQLYPKAAHNVVPSAAGHLNAWIAARFRGEPAPGHCG